MMAIVNKEGYIERETGSEKKRDWWLIKQYTSHGNQGKVDTKIYFPSKYLGKRVRLKVEVIDDGDRVD